MKINSFQDLHVWQRGMELAKGVYGLTKQLPREELYGLTNQLRRSAVSIPSNIAEGTKRGTRKDYIQFLRIASGSAAEVETQLFLAHDLYKVDIAATESLLKEVQKMLESLIRKLSA